MSDGAPQVPPARGRVQRTYRAIAVLVLNTLVLLVAVNAALHFVVPPPSDGPVALDRSTGGSGWCFDAARQLPPAAFMGLGADDLHQLCTEAGAVLARGLVFEPFTQFKERPCTGRFVNVTADGYRRSADQGPWPPDPQAVNVFVFGGSTTFGYGIADDQSIPSRLREFLGDVRVYNFGRGFYFSTQERVLFEQLLLQGTVPDVVVFVDGLNDFLEPTGMPAYTRQFAEFLAARSRGTRGWPARLVDVLMETPIGRAAAAARVPTASGTVLVPGAEQVSLRERARRVLPPHRAVPRAARHVIMRLLRNADTIEAIAHRRGVQAFFVWQPVPMYDYDATSHPFRGAAVPVLETGYAEAAKLHRAGRLGPHAIWCANLQHGLHEALYLDQFHYTPAMSVRVARCIADGLAGEGLVLRRHADGAGPPP
jgi:hypothetical protein